MHFCGRERGREDAIPAVLRHEAVLRLLDERYQRLLRRGASGDREGVVVRGTVPPFDLDYIYNSLKTEARQNGSQLQIDIETFNSNKEKMDRFAHYYNRFTAHEQGQRYAESQIPHIERRMDELALAFDLKSGADSDYIQDANRALIAGRRVLKYSYCYAYRSVDDVHRGLFQNHQELLERFVEELSRLYEWPVGEHDRKLMVDLTFHVRRYMDAVLHFDASVFERERCSFSVGI